MQVRKYPLCKRTGNAGYPRQIVDAGCLHAAYAAEVREQCPAPRGADSRNVLERRRGARLAPPRAMALDREAMRLIAYLLDQMQRRMFTRQL